MRKRPTVGLVQLLHSTRSSSCLDPRDRLFAMLDLASAGRKLGIQPDYTKAVSEVYRDFMVSDCRAWSSLRIIENCDTLDAKAWSNDLPSWVPDWSKAYFTGKIWLVMQAALKAPPTSSTMESWV